MLICKYVKLALNIKNSHFLNHSFLGLGVVRNNKFVAVLNFDSLIYIPVINKDAVFLTKITFA